MADSKTPADAEFIDTEDKTDLALGTDDFKVYNLTAVTVKIQCVGDYVEFPPSGHVVMKESPQPRDAGVSHAGIQVVRAYPFTPGFSGLAKFVEEHPDYPPVIANALVAQELAQSYPGVVYCPDTYKGVIRGPDKQIVGSTRLLRYTPYSARVASPKTPPLPDGADAAPQLINDV